MKTIKTFLFLLLILCLAGPSLGQEGYIHRSGGSGSGTITAVGNSTNTTPLDGSATGGTTYSLYDGVGKKMTFEITPGGIVGGVDKVVAFPSSCTDGYYLRVGVSGNTWTMTCATVSALSGGTQYRPAIWTSATAVGDAGANGAVGTALYSAGTGANPVWGSGINPVEYTITPTGGGAAAALTPANGSRQKLTLTASTACIITVAQPSTGTANIVLKIVQPHVTGAGTYTITGAYWPSGVAPTILTTIDTMDVVSCYLDGTYTYCGVMQDMKTAP